MLGTLWAGPAWACISNVKFPEVTDRSITLTWDNGCPATVGGGAYVLRTEPAVTEALYEFFTPGNKTATFLWKNEPRLLGIQPNAKIQFSIIMADLATGQKWTFTISTITAALPPDPPDLPKAPYFAVVWDRMTVQWERGSWFPTPSVKITNYPDTNFQLQLALTSDFAAPVFDQTAPVTEMSVGCLEPLTVYYSRVRALNRGNRPTTWTLLGSTRTPTMGGVPPSSYTWDSSRWQVTFPSGSLSQRDTVLVSSMPTISPVRSASVAVAIEKANGKMLARGDVRQTPLYLSEIRLDHGCPAVESDDLLQPVSIDVGFALVGGYVNSPGGLLRPETLRLYRLDETDGLWVRVPNSQRLTETRLAASVQKLGVFGVFGAPDDSLKDVFAYPTPYSRAQGGAGITFVNMPEQATLTLFSAAGTPVRTLEESDGDGRLLWDTRNTSGEPVAPGVYFYLLESPSEKRKGRVMIQP